MGVRGSPRSTRGLVAYTNSDLFLIRPADMACSGAVGADGGSEVVVWPKGQRSPHQHSPSDGLTLTVDPACVSCMAFDACPFFRSFASKLGFPCMTGIPAGEVVDQLSADVAGFRDPAGVAGDGRPSGGRDPANGLVGIRVSAAWSRCNLHPARPEARNMRGQPERRPRPLRLAKAVPAPTAGSDGDVAGAERGRERTMRGRAPDQDRARRIDGMGARELKRQAR